jgi:phosphatidylserine decarboxylase
MDIKYIERKTGDLCIEKVYGHQLLILFYGDGWINLLLSFLVLPLLVWFPFFSRVYGRLQKRPGSVKKIVPFIAAYGIDATEFARGDFSSFNDFFIRKLKKERRPIEMGKSCLTMPADGRYLVYPEFTRFFVKGQEFCLETFLQNPILSRRFADGAMVIARLCPIDYHRFHFPCDGTPSQARLIKGPLYSVNPMALRKRIGILSENKRMITEMATDFGTLLYIEIGATNVGSIHQTYTPNQPVRKGDEKGYFEFGGSCLVLLFEKGRVVFDRDLIENTKKGLETRVNFGERLGVGL